MGRVVALGDPFCFAHDTSSVNSVDTFPRRGRLESNVCSHYAEGGLVASRIFAVWRSRIEHTASDTAEIEEASNVVLAFLVRSK